MTTHRICQSERSLASTLLSSTSRQMSLYYRASIRNQRKKTSLKMEHHIPLSPQRVHTSWINVVSMSFQWNYVESMWNRLWIDLCGQWDLGKTINKAYVCFLVKPWHPFFLPCRGVVEVIDLRTLARASVILYAYWLKWDTREWQLTDQKLVSYGRNNVEHSMEF